MSQRNTQIGYINNTGGIDLLIKKFKEIGFWEGIDAALGKRNARAEYSYSDAIQTWTMNMISGSKRLEHSSEHSHKHENNPHFRKGMSPDTISRTLRKLACDNVYYGKRTKDNGKNVEIVENPTQEQKEHLNEVNYNRTLNELLLDSAIKLGLLEKGKSYILDIDATIIPTKVSDSRVHYKGNGTGYCPMVVILGGIPVFLEARNGNSSPMFRQKEVLKLAIDLFESRGILVSAVRIDAAGSNQYVIKFLNEMDIKFYIRRNDKLRSKDTVTSDWSILASDKKLSTSEENTIVDSESYRVVNYKRYNADKTWSIITNDCISSAEEIISIYNGRAKQENRFADLKDMGWNYMVHREMKLNTVHLLITMLAYLLFLYSKQWLSKKLPFVKESFEPKTFIKKFVLVLTTWFNGKLNFVTRRKEFDRLELS